MEKFGGYTTEVKEMIETTERLTLRNNVKEEEHSKRHTAERGYRNQNAFSRPKGLRENAETAISCRGPGPPRKKKEVYQYIVERRRKEPHTDVPL